MILIGQYDSPFVRRVGITLHLYDTPYEHRAWSVWGDADKIAAYNPLRRVPVLVLDDGSVLTESSAIVDSLDDQVGTEHALLPRSGSLRRDGLRLAALCTGFADKAVSLLYEGIFRKPPLPSWQARCTSQILDTLELLEQDRAARDTLFWLDSRIGHVDVVFACAYRFTCEAHPNLLDPGRFPALAGHAARCEALPAFHAVYQPIVNNL